MKIYSVKDYTKGACLIVLEDSETGKITIPKINGFKEIPFEEAGIELSIIDIDEKTIADEQLMN